MLEIPIPESTPIKLPRYYSEFLHYYPDAEWETKRWVVKNVDEDWVIFDCGANIGYYTILFARLAKNGIVHAFEPTNTYDMLVENIKFNDMTNVRLINKALGKKSGKVEETIYRVWGTPPEKGVYDFITIDDYCKENKINKLDLIKIDTDGFDFDILMGAKETLKKLCPVVLVEIYDPTLNERGYNSKMMLDWLNVNGYKTQYIFESNYIMFK